MDSKVKDLELLVEKISRMVRNFQAQSISNPQIELMKDYALQLYTKLVELQAEKTGEAKLAERMKRNINPNMLNNEDLSKVKNLDSEIYEQQKDVNTVFEKLDEKNLDVLLEKEPVRNDELTKTETSDVKNNDQSQNKLTTFISDKQPIVKDVPPGKHKTDIRTIMGLNDKFFFINEFFKGDHNAFDKAMQQVNNLGSYEETLRYIEGDLKIRYGGSNDESVARLTELVKLKFST
jgi:hypothetical protein